MNTIDTVSRQWATRPSDQRFASLTDLHAFVSGIRSRSAGKVVSNRALEVVPTSNDTLAVHGPNGVPTIPTHWAFGQLAQRSGAPAAYLRELPAPLAADCLNWGLRHARDVESVGVLVTRSESGDTTELRAATGPNYGRIWNQSITRQLVDRFGDGLSGQFHIPGEFGKRVAITKENTTLYASDRDLFVFLADEENRIEVPNRRDGKTGSLARGIMIQNSEVGASTLVLSTVLFDYMCSNRIIWGALDYQEVRIRHTAGAPDRWLEEMSPAIVAYANSSAANVTEAVKLAQAARVDDVDAFLRKRFSGRQVEAIKAAHMSDEGRPIETLWDASTGVTAYARSLAYQDERVTLEREGGRILSLAA